MKGLTNFRLDIKSINANLTFLRCYKTWTVRFKKDSHEKSETEVKLLSQKSEAVQIIGSTVA